MVRLWILDIQELIWTNAFSHTKNIKNINIKNTYLFVEVNYVMVNNKNCSSCQCKCNCNGHDLAK